MDQEKEAFKIIKEICEEKGIKYSLLSFDWILELNKNDKIVHISGFKFDLNGVVSTQIASDKYATYCVLSSLNIPACECNMVFNPAMRGDYVPKDGNDKLINDLFSKYGKVVVKPNYGLEGKNVFLCTSMKEIEMAVKQIFTSQPSLSVCPYYDIKKEYRAIYLNGKVKLIYGKEKPFVVGDGVSSLKELIEKISLPNNDVVKENLKNLKMEYIPQKDEIVYLSWKFNLCGGATPELLVDEDIYNKVEQLAIKAAKAINIMFASVDVIQTYDDEFKILEINSSVCGELFIKNVENGYEKMKEIYSEAIDLMLKDT